ncbi:MAG: hypothetical protein HUU34_11460 [Saprospiraceae bacterium]|jgi:hypothetical protein|nr:hypothetical protein [Saprospiraceae bacterium]
MLKKLTIGLLAGMALLMQTGIRVDIHHCGDESAYRFLGLHFGLHCACPDSHHDTPNNCCDDDEVFVKANTTHWLSTSVFTFFEKINAIAALPPIVERLWALPVVDTDPPSQSGHGPPGFSAFLFLLHCVFRF